jgi:ketosteroid isomerase-like protein
MTHGCLLGQFASSVWTAWDFRKNAPYTGAIRRLPMTDQDLLRTIYAAFNHRDIDAVLTAMHPEVDWPNGMEGGRVYGQEAVRQYWQRQWEQINPVVEPRSFHTDPTGAIVVEVHQVIRDLSGALLADRMVQHVYRIQDGLILSMEIKEVPQKP